MKDLKKLANECMAELDAIGVQYGNVISWEVNTRAKNRWGQCRYIGGGRYSISIINRLLDDNLPDEAAKQTIIHELLHSVDELVAEVKKEYGETPQIRKIRTNNRKIVWVK